MSAVKKLIYIGHDDIFSSELTELCKLSIRTEFLFQKFTWTPESFMSLITSTEPNIVYFDLSDIELGDHFFETLALLKKHRQFKRTLYVAILKDAQDRKELLHLFSSGFQYGFIKGGELRSCVVDSLYIGLGEEVRLPQFARAKKINQKLNIGFCSSLSQISLENFWVETDLNLDTDIISLKLPLFKDLEIDSYSISRHKSAPCHYPMLETYIIKYPYAGPWDDVSCKTIQKETVETWLENNQERLVKSFFFLKFIIRRSEEIQFLSKLASEQNFFHDIDDTLNPTTLADELYLKKPPLIFYELDPLSENGEEQENSLSQIPMLLTTVKSIQNYNPILIVSNCPSQGEALRKAYGYSNIVCVPKNLSIENIKVFVEKFMQKMKLAPTEAIFNFPASDKSRAIDVKYEVTVSSFTEHEVTFICDLSLPMFSIIHLPLPIDCFATIIPPYFDIGSSRHGKHYLAIIHTLEEDELKRLRKFVNQIIYKPLKEFTKAEVELILNQSEKNEKTEIGQLAAKKPEKENTKDKDIVSSTFKRTVIKGTSKL